MTENQARLLEFIRSYLERKPGVPPTFAEMADAMGLRSRSGIARLLAALEEQGRIQRLPNRARSIKVVEGGVMEKAREMRNAIDMIEGALMVYGDLVDLPRIFEGARDDLRLSTKVTAGQMRRVCKALEECTRIINSDEYLFAKAVR